MTVVVASSPSAAEVSLRVDRTLRGPVSKALKRQRPLTPAMVEDLQLGALRHRDAKVRRWCVFLLDHYANDQSTEVFAQALHDGAHPVRDMALHSIACEPCKEGELCVADTVPHVVHVLRHDPKADLRIKAIAVLLRLAHRDERARQALEQAAADDADPQVRSCAREAVNGRFAPPKKRYERAQRRHAAPTRSRG